MRDRLIELLQSKYDHFCDQCGVNKQTSYIKNLADYLLANGVIAPPCNVGDTVYHFCDEFGCILPYFVETLKIGFLDKDRHYWSWEANSHAEYTDEFLDEIDFDLDDIGKFVFLTKEEAEQAMRRSEP